MHNKKKVALVGPDRIVTSPDRAGGGIEASSRSLSLLLKDMSKAYVICFDDINKSKVIRKNRIVYIVLAKPSRVSSTLSLYLIWSIKILFALNRADPDKVLVQGISYMTKGALFYSLRKTYLIVHGVMHREYRPRNFFDWFSSRSLKWLVVSLDELISNLFVKNVVCINREIEKIYNNKKTFFMSNYIDKGKAEKIDQYFLSDVHRENKIIFVGNVIPRKRPLELVKSFRSLNLPDWRLMIVGKNHKDNYAGEIEREIRGQANISWLSDLDDDALLENLCKAKVFCLPSLAESSPISIMEAQTAGCFVVSSNIGGIPELINEEIGIMIDQVEELTPALLASTKITSWERVVVGAKNQSKNYSYSKAKENLEIIIY